MQRKMNREITENSRNKQCKEKREEEGREKGRNLRNHSTAVEREGKSPIWCIKKPIKHSICFSSEWGEGKKNCIRLAWKKGSKPIAMKGGGKGDRRAWCNGGGRRGMMNLMSPHTSKEKKKAIPIFPPWGGGSDSEKGEREPGLREERVKMSLNIIRKEEERGEISY